MYCKEHGPLYRPSSAVRPIQKVLLLADTFCHITSKEPQCIVDEVPMADKHRGTAIR